MASLGSYRSGADRFILRMLMAQFAAAARLGIARAPGPVRPRSTSSIQLLLDVCANEYARSVTHRACACGTAVAKLASVSRSKSFW
jgi:hypothetical protein